MKNSKLKDHFKKRFDQIAEKLYKEISDNTPVDTRKLKDSLKKNELWEFTVEIVFDNMEYARDVEYWQGVAMNYHLEDGTIFRDIWAWMIRKTIDKFEWKIWKEFEISQKY